MTFARSRGVSVIIPKQALEVVFDECDRYDADETGGRILGVYKQDAHGLAITVTGIIEPGPKAKRTGTYLKQDGAFQEKVFREIESNHPEIEHLGNWHTHHVNGYPELSGGDVETYRRTVAHKNHNTDFFYALLVTRKRGGAGLGRYEFKNYLLRRGDSRVYEIPEGDISVSDDPIVWPRLSSPTPTARHTPHHPYANAGAVSVEPSRNRVVDSEVVSSLYPDVKPYQSERLGLYWRGPIPLVDGSAVEVVVLEQDGGASHSVTIRDAPNSLAGALKAISEAEFPSARTALLSAERACNAALYGGRSSGRGKKKWTF